MQLSVIQFTIEMFHTGFMQVLILMSLKSLKHLNCKLYYQKLHLKNCVTWQGIDYKLSEDDKIVSKH